MSPELTIVLRVWSFVLGGWIVFSTIMSVIRMLILPRSENVWLTRQVFGFVLRVFEFRLHKIDQFERRDRTMALFSPISLLVLIAIWLILVTIGFMFMFWAVGVPYLYDAFLLSGSSLLTLGFAPVSNLPEMLLSFAESAIGLILVALLIAYLPTIYTGFSKREKMVAMLEVRAGSPPSATEMLIRFYRNDGAEELNKMWREWEEWFVELEESHTSLSPIIFFRSPNPNRSWITAAGVVLDCAAMMESVIDTPPNMQTRLAIRAGFTALRSIADFFRMPYDPKPNPDDPISIQRDEFDDACAELLQNGVPLVADLDQAWKNYSGWRVNYDGVLLRLALLTMAPYAQWVSDRSFPTPWYEPIDKMKEFKEHAKM